MPVEVLHSQRNKRDKKACWRVPSANPASDHHTPLHCVTWWLRKLPLLPSFGWGAYSSFDMSVQIFPSLWRAFQLRPLGSHLSLERYRCSVTKVSRINCAKLDWSSSCMSLKWKEDWLICLTHSLSTSRSAVTASALVGTDNCNGCHWGQGWVSITMSNGHC